MFNRIQKIFIDNDPLNGTIDLVINQKSQPYERSLSEYVQSDKNKRNILHRAALEQNPKLIQDIITSYSQISLRTVGQYICQPDQFGITAVQMCCFANYNQRAQCLKLLSEDADFDSFNPRNLWSVAHWVAFYGDIQSLDLLLKKRVLMFRPEYQGYYPLDLAGKNDKKDCATRIINYLMAILIDYEKTKITQKPTNAYFDIYLQDYDRYLTNPLLKVSMFYWSCYFGLELTQFTLLENFNCFAPYLNTTPLHIAVRKNDLKAVEFILSYLESQDKQLIQVQSIIYPTYTTNRVYEFTKEETKIYKLRYLKQVLDFDIWQQKYKNKQILVLDQQDSFGNTPLHLASIENNADSINLLISKDSSVECENKEMWKPSDLATDPDAVNIYKHNEKSRLKLQRSIRRYLQSCEIIVNRNLKKEQPMMLRNSITRLKKPELQDHLAALYDQSKRLQTPDYVLKCDGLQVSKLNFQISLLVNAKFQVYLAQSKLDDSYYIMLKHPIQELQLQAMIQKMEVKLIDSFDYEPYDLIMKDAFEPFRSLQRQAIIEKHLNRIINLEELKDSELILEHYRMHSFGGAAKIRNKWIEKPKWYWPQPLNQMDDYLKEGAEQNFTSITLLRLYFGEKIAFFFAWKSYLTCMSIAVAIPGLALQVYILVTNNFKTMLIPLWVIYLSIWSTICVEFWKRKSCEINARWGMLDLMNSEELKPRAEFSGDEEMHLISKEINKHERKIYTVVIFLISIPILILLTSVVVGIFIGIDQFQTENQITSVYYKILVGILQGVCIAILNIIYTTFVYYFVEKENHKFEQHHESSLIYKNVLFKFINCYLAVFYAAYLKTGSTYDELFYLLLPVLAVKQFSYILITVIIPQLLYKYKEDLYFNRIQNNMSVKSIFLDSIDILWHRVTEKVLQSVPRAVLNVGTGQLDPNFDMDTVELNGLKLAATNNLTIIYFMENMIDFGYITLFSAAFPIGPVISLIMSMVEIRMKIYTFIFVYKKPHPERAAGIGEWLHIWEVLSFCGVFTNYALLFLKQEAEINEYLFPGNNILKTNMMWLFIMAVFINVLLKYGLQVLIPDKPNWVVDLELEQQEKKKTQSRMNNKEEECEQLYVKVSKLERQYNQLLKQQQKHQDISSALQSPQKQSIEHENSFVNSNAIKQYYQLERDLLIERLEQVRNIVKLKRIVVLVCAECQLKDANKVCKECSLQLCNECYVQYHKNLKLDHSQAVLAVPNQGSMWRKMQQFALPTYQQSPFYQSLVDAFEILSAHYEGKQAIQLFLNLEDLNLEDKLLLNKIMYMLHRRQKVSWNEFCRQTKILQSGTLEQKIVQLVDMLDEDDDQLVSPKEAAQFITCSMIQDIGIKQPIINLFDADNYEKKELIRRIIVQISNQSQIRELFSALLQT